ncbi:hypothetical protein FACS1894109_21350 [Spirochaetia bacterium]|nr:hypothetical protein FACS1894109_21350 [Spirochaetia bacterium]
MYNKLTLDIEQETIKNAKIYARNQNTAHNEAVGKVILYKKHVSKSPYSGNKNIV